MISLTRDPSCDHRHPVNSYLVRPFNPFTAKGDLIDFTLSNARRFYSSKGDPLEVKGLKNYLLTLSLLRATY